MSHKRHERHQPWQRSLTDRLSESHRRLTRPARSLLARGWLGCVAFNQFRESGLVADRVEVAVPGSKRTERFLAVDREPEMLDRVVCPSGEALAAREVVKR